PTTEEQDLLRAMVVFAGAGLDAALKQAAQDALYDVAQAQQPAREALAKFVELRFLRGEPEVAALAGVNTKELSRLILSGDPLKVAVESLARDLSGRSLQSFEELQRTLEYFGAANLKLNTQQLRVTFENRNRIVHEMDMDLKHRTRKRRARRRDEMLDHARVLLETADKIVTEVDARLNSSP
ncbi:MAG: hypothetical protein QN209_02805, partial [Armatimonadota bacterium]|nr:hypothetical protein [Armatimonadota bacterium]